MKTTATFVMILTAALAACEAGEDATVETTPAEDMSAAPPVAEPVDAPIATAQFQGTDGGDAAQISGTADLRRSGAAGSESVELDVHLMGLPGGDHAWHIHEGGCDNVGSIVVPLSNAGDREGIAGDLSSEEGGMVEETVELDGEQLAMLSAGTSYSVNVHSGNGESPGAPIACATLELPADWSVGTAADTAPVDGI